MTRDMPPDGPPGGPLLPRGWLAGFALGLGLALVAGYRLLRPAQRPTRPLPAPDSQSAPAVPQPALSAPPETPPEPQGPSPRRLALFFGLVITLAALLVALPYGLARLLLFGAMGGGFLLGLYAARGGIMDRLRAILPAVRQARRETDLPRNLLPDRRIPPPLLLIELGAVILLALSVTGDYRVANPDTRLAGGEAEWLTSSVHLAHDSLRDYGYIPTWQPYLRFGEPLLDGPFGFLLNPLSAGPGLLVGGTQGVKYSVALYAVFAALGGWFLGWTLGLGTPGRLLLAGLLLGKGSMSAMIGSGYFQLGVSQTYLPWVTGGALLILRGHPRRWPVVLTALMFTLMFWAGNIWYTLPLLLSLGLLALSHTLRLHPRRWVNRSGLGRLLLAGLLTVTLSAALLLPLWSHRDYIGGHKDEIEAGAVVPLLRIIPLYANPDIGAVGALPVYEPLIGPRTGTVNLYYSYVTPPWLLALLFGLLPPVWPVLHRPPAAGWRRVWGVGVFMIAFCTLWGAGGSGLFLWLYDNVPLLAQWRFVGRALAVASFWLAVLIAMRADGLLRALTWRLGAALRGGDRFVPLLRGLLAVGVAGAAALAVYSVTRTWEQLAPTQRVNTFADECVSWLRDRYPGEPLAARRAGYQVITTFIANRVRQSDIEADYHARPLEWTLGHTDFTALDPRFAIWALSPDEDILRGRGYAPVPDSPIIGGFPCLYEKRAPTLPYAFFTSLDALDAPLSSFPVAEAAPVADVVRLPDQITLRVDADAAQPRVVVIAELAYPGWQVTVDGEPGSLEVVGGAVGVLLAPDGQSHTVQFAYRPPLLYLGGAITVGTAVLCALYLLGADRLIRRLWRLWRKSG